MAIQLVPYNTAMQLGSGFNSFTQTLCIDNAVARDADLTVARNGSENDKKEVAQSVTYKTHVISKATDVTDEMKISGAFNIKYDQLAVEGVGSFINANKIKESDVTIMVSVKVINQIIYDHALIKFQPLANASNIPPQHLVDIYGDSFISGWQEGGEFLAVISIKARNRDEAQTIAANARVAYSNQDSKTRDSDSKDLNLDLKARFDKMKQALASENEVSVSVTWNGGGQKLKAPEQDWDFDTMKEVALKFPDLCAKTPVRTHALLTKYSALRSFYAAQTPQLPSYDKTGTYTNVLQEAYLDYKSILGHIQVLAYDVCEGTKALINNPRSKQAAELTSSAPQVNGVSNGVTPTKSAPPDKDSDNESNPNPGREIDVPAKVITPPPPSMEQPFPPNIAGLEEARLRCRFMMNRIVQEIDNIAIKPEIATDETRQPPYLSPFLFKLLLPLGVDVTPEPTQAAQAVAASKVDPDILTQKFTGVAA